jgi:hypothetical protein
VALNEIFLCLPTPEPPNDVDFSAVNETGGPMKTLRERLMAHSSNKTCAACHQLTDPIGLSLEAFDTIGGYRTIENGQKIDVSASIQGKTFSGAQGLGQYMHDNPRYPACVARKLYSYGRGLTRSTVNDFEDAYKAFQDSGFRLRTLLRSMAVSESFYAVGPPGKTSLHNTTEVAAN